MTDHDKLISQSNGAVHEAWDRNASFWDEHMGDGNDFFELLIRPPTERFLEIRRGDSVLDIACGYGVSSRRLAGLGAKVVALDFSAEMIGRARSRSGSGAEIEYFVLDAFEERAFPPSFEGGSTPLSFSGKFNEIPPVLVCRMRPCCEYLSGQDAVADADRPCC